MAKLSLGDNGARSPRREGKIIPLTQEESK